MAVETTQILGTVYDPTGAPAARVRLRIRLSTRATAPDGAARHVVGSMPVEVRANDAGEVDFLLIPNDVLDPAGTTYLVSYETPAGARWDDRPWQLASTPDPIQIGSIPRV